MSESTTTIGEPSARTARRSPGTIPVIGLTGTVGAGKSAVAAKLGARGAVVIDADAVGHETLRRPEVAAQVEARFGTGVLDAEGAVDRRALGRVVFADPSARRDLETLVHPPMFEAFERAIADAERGDAPFVVLDAAILLETGWDRACDLVVFVDAPRPLRLERVGTSRGWTDEQLRARESAQWPGERKKSRADYVLLNDGSSTALDEAVDRLVDWAGERLAGTAGGGRPSPSDARNR